MLTVSLLALGLIGTCFVLLAPMLARLFKGCAAEDITPEWLASFSPSVYYPMHGLLANEDFQFLARQPGFDLSLYRKLRRERMLIFRQYLGRLVSDFNKLHAYALLVLSHGDTDQSTLVKRLAILRLRFTLSVVSAEFSYYLCVLGIGSLATRSVVARLEELSAQLGLNNSGLPSISAA